jgi:hypothetical protein
MLTSPPCPTPLRKHPLPRLAADAPTRVPGEEALYGANKSRFSFTTLMCDALAALSPEHLRLCISTLWQFGRQGRAGGHENHAGDSLKILRRDECV